MVWKIYINVILLFWINANTLLHKGVVRAVKNSKTDELDRDALRLIRNFAVADHPGFVAVLILCHFLCDQNSRVSKPKLLQILETFTGTIIAFGLENAIWFSLQGKNQRDFFESVIRGVPRGTCFLDTNKHSELIHDIGVSITAIKETNNYKCDRIKINEVIQAIGNSAVQSSHTNVA